MKYIKPIFLLCILLLFPLTTFASTNDITPRASYVFADVGSFISKTSYGGDCSLMYEGSGHITIYLQKKNSSGSWVDVEGSSSKKTFSETTLAAHSKAKILSAGTYRCKTYVIGYVNGYTDRRTVYSPVLTLK